MKECFESQGIAKLQEAIKSMQSGLWNPANDDPETSAEDGFKVRKEDKDNEDPDADGDENVYAEVK